MRNKLLIAPALLLASFAQASVKLPASVFPTQQGNSCENHSARDRHSLGQAYFTSGMATLAPLQGSNSAFRHLFERTAGQAEVVHPVRIPSFPSHFVSYSFRPVLRLVTDVVTFEIEAMPSLGFNLFSVSDNTSGKRAHFAIGNPNLRRLEEYSPGHFNAYLPEVSSFTLSPDGKTLVYSYQSSISLMELSTDFVFLNVGDLLKIVADAPAMGDARTMPIQALPAPRTLLNTRSRPVAGIEASGFTNLKFSPDGKTLIAVSKGAFEIFALNDAGIASIWPWAAGNYEILSAPFGGVTQDQAPLHFIDGFFSADSKELFIYRRNPERGSLIDESLKIVLAE